MSESGQIKCFLVVATRRKWKETRAGSVVEGTWWKRTDTGELVKHLSQLPAGAMWFAPWLDRTFKPQLKHVLVVKTPGGDWVIDQQASNCTMPNQPIEGTTDTFNRYQEDHHCWILHGDPPDVTVDKNGVTCGAGAGSILQGSYHGFLRNGYLVPT